VPQGLKHGFDTGNSRRPSLMGTNPPASNAPVDLVLGELGGVGGVVWLACAEFAASLPVKKY